MCKSRKFLGWRYHRSMQLAIGEVYAFQLGRLHWATSQQSKKKYFQERKQFCVEAMEQSHSVDSLQQLNSLNLQNSSDLPVFKLLKILFLLSSV